jgi:hypothetical protein
LVGAWFVKNSTFPKKAITQYTACSSVRKNITQQVQNAKLAGGLKSHNFDNESYGLPDFFNLSIRFINKQKSVVFWLKQFFTSLRLYNRH